MVQNTKNMTKKTITKFFAFVIFFAAIISIFSGCLSWGSPNPESTKSSRYDKPKILGNIVDPDITESSGLAASKCQPGVFWTHNDSGDDAFIYGITQTGATLGTWKVPGAQNIDWEDIAEYRDASGKCFIYVGEIGDNRSKMAEHMVYRVREPVVTPDDSASNKNDPLSTEPPELLRFTYPDGAHNAETLMVNPTNGDIYIVTKRQTGPAGVYRLRPEFGAGRIARAEKVGDLSVPAVPNGLITGGDISPDGRRLIICDYVRGYEYTLPDGSTYLDDIWKQEPETVDLGNRSVGEAVCYSNDGTSLFASSEGKAAPMIWITRKP